MTVSEIIIQMDEVDNIISTMVDSYDEDSRKCSLDKNTADKIIRILQKYSVMLGNKEVKE